MESQRAINWNHAAYRSEVSASKLPGRAKSLLWWVFEESARIGSAEISASLAEASDGIFNRTGERLKPSTIRRALADLSSLGIVTVRENPGSASTWVFDQRKLWSLETGESEAAAIERRIEELKQELAGLERRREILFGPRPSRSQGVQQSQGSQLQGGWNVHLSEAEVSSKGSGRSVFSKFVSAGLLVDDPETERDFFAFLFTVGDLYRKKKIRSRAGYVAGAVRRGYWRVNLNPEFLPTAAELQSYLDSQAGGRDDGFGIQSLVGISSDAP